jgi:hypothetical protein
MISIGYELSQHFPVANLYICWEWLLYVGQYGKREIKLVLWKKNDQKPCWNHLFCIFFYALLDRALSRRGTTSYKQRDRVDANSGSQAVGQASQETEADVVR